MTETHDVTNPLIRAINKIPGCVARRQHAGALRRNAHAGAGGWPDIFVGVLGEAFFIETKVPGGKLRDNQKRMHEHLGRCGFAVYVVDSVKVGIALVRKRRLLRESESGRLGTGTPKATGDHNELDSNERSGECMAR